MGSSLPCDSSETFCNNRRRNICPNALLGVGCFSESPHLLQISESGVNPGIRGQSLVLTQSRNPHSANLPPREIIAADIVDDLEAALAQFADISNDIRR